MGIYAWGNRVRRSVYGWNAMVVEPRIHMPLGIGCVTSHCREIEFNEIKRKSRY